MSADKAHARITLDDTRPYPLEVRVYDAAGNLKRVISSAALQKRGEVVPIQHPPELGHRDTERPTVSQSSQAWRRTKTTPGRRRSVK